MVRPKYTEVTLELQIDHVSLVVSVYIIISIVGG